jgi:hypothetical protein
MRKTATFIGVGLLFLVVAAAALAAGPSALLGPPWTGEITTVTRTVDGNVTTISDNATLIFTDESGDYLAGTLTIKSPPAVLAFTCIRNGRSLQMTAPDTLMAAEIFLGHPVKKGARPPQNMAIQGRNVADGTMFEGTLTKAKK